MLNRHGRKGPARRFLFPPARAERAFHPDQEQFGKYRPEIDGLRAIAVIFVFLFHLDESWLPGGFVGVDIFYVISGFVIFRLMIPEVADGNFRISAFYKRRLRRIFPSLVLTVIFCLIAGFFVLTPREYQSLAGDSLAAVFSVSNIHYGDRLDYFADSANTIALLHTWSLGVEEQFYLLVPIFAVMSVKYFGIRGLFRGLILICLLSFLCNMLMIYGLGQEEKAFYWPVSRFWEIAVGGVVACLESRVRLRNGISVLAGMIGLSGIFASAIWIDTSMPFPAVAALLPVLSTALFIFAAVPATSPVFRILSSGPMRFYGRISYSLYLFHWPVIVFTGLYLGRSLTMYESLMLLAATSVLAAANWKFVETPFRKGGYAFHWPRARNALAVSVLVACAFSAMVMSTQGFPSRMRHPLAAEWDWNLTTRLDLSRCKSVAALDSIPEATGCSYTATNRKIDYLLWGDSHAAMITPQLFGALEELGLKGVVATMPACPPLIGVYTSKRKNREECFRLAERIASFVSERQIGTVVLASRWANLASPVRAPGDGAMSKTIYSRKRWGQPLTLSEALRRTIDTLRAAGTDVVIVGPVPETDFHVPDTFLRSQHLGLDVPRLRRTDFNLRQSIVLTALRDLEKLPGVSVVFPHRYLCDDNACEVAQGSVPLYRDDDHLSRAGVDLILPPIVTAVVKSG